MGAAEVVITKLVAAVLAVTAYVRAIVVLHVTPNRVPRDESSWVRISLFAVTAVVFTVTAVAAAEITTAPAAATPQSAGVAVPSAQLLAVP